jgi:hypothetical protein
MNFELAGSRRVCIWLQRDPVALGGEVIGHKVQIFHGRTIGTHVGDHGFFTGGPVGFIV